MSEQPVSTVPAAAVEEGAKKSGILWLALDRPRLAWHAWHDGAVYLVSGGAEQQLPGLESLDRVRVTLRSKDNGARLAEFEATVEAVDQTAADDAAADAVADAVAVLAKERLNARDTEHLAERWARESTVWRLTPLL